MFNLDRIFDRYSKSHERYRLAATLEGHSGPINSFAFNPSGTMLASRGKDILVLLFA
jgi:WD40 repeat protein